MRPFAYLIHINAVAYRIWAMHPFQPQLQLLHQKKEHTQSSQSSDSATAADPTSVLLASVTFGLRSGLGVPVGRAGGEPLQQAPRLRALGPQHQDELPLQAKALPLAGQHHRRHICSEPWERGIGLCRIQRPTIHKQRSAKKKKLFFGH